MDADIEETINVKKAFSTNTGFYANWEKERKRAKCQYTLIRVPKELDASILSNKTIRLPSSTAKLNQTITLNDEYELVLCEEHPAEKLLVPQSEKLVLQPIPTLWTVRRRLDDASGESGASSWGVELDFDKDVVGGRRPNRPQPANLKMVLSPTNMATVLKRSHQYRQHQQQNSSHSLDENVIIKEKPAGTKKKKKTL